MKDLDLTFGLFRVIWDDGEDVYVSHFILMMNDNTNEMTEDSKNRLAHYLNGNGEIIKTQFVNKGIVVDSHIKEGCDCVKDRFFEMYFM